MATWKVAPALAAGCAAILKPSELSSMYVRVNIHELSLFLSFLVCLFASSCLPSCFQYQNLFGASRCLSRGGPSFWCPQYSDWIRA